jgi:hypothetical protein
MNNFKARYGLFSWFVPTSFPIYRVDPNRESSGLVFTFALIGASRWVCKKIVILIWNLHDFNKSIIYILVSVRTSIINIEIFNGFGKNQLFRLLSFFNISHRNLTSTIQDESNFNISNHTPIYFFSFKIIVQASTYVILSQ